MNTFGFSLRLTTFGESHGEAIGGVLDGMPSNLKIDFDLIDTLIQRRQGGRNAFVTPRFEEDRVEFLSGIFEGATTGAPIAFIVRNHHSQSKDYQRGILDPLTQISHIFINTAMLILEEEGEAVQEKRSFA